MDKRMAGVIAAALLLGSYGTALAADIAASYPERPIRLIVPQAAGSSSDTVARFVAAELTRVVGQQVVVDNRPGGALMIGLELTAMEASCRLPMIPLGVSLPTRPVKAAVKLGSDAPNTRVLLSISTVSGAGVMTTLAPTMSIV